MDLRNTPIWGKYLSTIGWKSEGSFRVRPILFFSIIKWQRPENIEAADLQRLKKTALKHRALFAKVEVNNNEQAQFLLKSGFKPDSWPLTPAKTLILNLNSSLEDFHSNLIKDTRYSLRRAGKENLAVSVKDLKNASQKELNAFYSLWKDTAKRGKFYVPPEREFLKKMKIYEDRGFLVLISNSSDVFLAGAICLIEGSTCFYHHAGSSKEGQKLFAPYLCLWEVIKEAKKRGCKRLDLEGVYDSRFPKMTKGWEGFSRFKRGFGGEEKVYPGSYTKYLPFL